MRPLNTLICELNRCHRRVSATKLIRWQNMAGIDLLKHVRAYIGPLAAETAGRGSGPIR